MQLSDRGRAAPRQAGRPRRGQARLRPQLPAAQRPGHRPDRAQPAAARRYKERVTQAREAKIADLKVLAEQIQRVPHVTIEANANEEGHLYGSVGAAEISKALKGKNLKVEPDMVKLEGVIKECGLYEVEAEPRLRHRGQGQGHGRAAKEAARRSKLSIAARLVGFSVRECATADAGRKDRATRAARR